MIKVTRALISVSDKTGVLDFARRLAARGVEILSTGGTARLLRSGGVAVKEVGEHTGFPEILDGRVKTLHPKIHGGLLALRDNPAHRAQMAEHGIAPIDLVVVNLYPFARTVARPSVTLEEALENIDIGGPSMLRSGAKNFKSVAVVCNPARYPEVLQELDTNSGLLPDSVLMNLAVEAFQHTSLYDDMIYEYLSGRSRPAGLSGLPGKMSLDYVKQQDLRYGENPHQAGALYRRADRAEGLARLKQLGGKELSFNNLLDLNAAVEAVRDFDRPAAVVIKHNNPTGVALGAKLAEAYRAAHRCDPLSAFGGIIGLNRKVDAATARFIAKSGFMECVIAPGYDLAARKILTAKKNFRVIALKASEWRGGPLDFKPVCGGLLVQESDRKAVRPGDLQAVTKLQPTAAQKKAMLFGWTVVRHIRSNAIVLVKGERTVGIGCGQTSRVESVALAVKKAGRNARGAVLVSDAFIPKTDNVTLAAKAGVKAIIQTGGSVADPDVIKAADRAKIAMVFTGVRHFKH